eukprot:1675210-Amphidinium_carterae.1
MEVFRPELCFASCLWDCYELSCVIFLESRGKMGMHCHANFCWNQLGRSVARKETAKHVLQKMFKSESFSKVTSKALLQKHSRNGNWLCSPHFGSPL